MDNIPLGYPYKRELWEKWTQLFEEDIDCTEARERPPDEGKQFGLNTLFDNVPPGHVGNPQSSPDLDALELAIRLQQCAYCAAQLHTCIWERVARGRCTKRLRNKRLAPLEVSRPLCFHTVFAHLDILVSSKM
mmetsp:Transcript_7365/g.11016  ORF Transcript_7365/g.11016 Transcript_7365/m.11016 type:complete len:133 (-) Transcript_7365:466-864(-)